MFGTSQVLREQKAGGLMIVWCTAVVAPLVYIDQKQPLGLRKCCFY